MKNLKFRAFDKEEECMIYFSFDNIMIKNMSSIVLNGIQGKLEDILKAFDISRAVIMQSTGLTDKNGKEIFEGDICVDINKEEFVVNFFDEWGAFLLEKGKDTMAFYPGINIEIIGNIHENPELLDF